MSKNNPTFKQYDRVTISGFMQVPGEMYGTVIGPRWKDHSKVEVSIPNGVAIVPIEDLEPYVECPLDRAIDEAGEALTVSRSKQESMYPHNRSAIDALMRYALENDHQA